MLSDMIWKLNVSFNYGNMVKRFPFSFVCYPGRKEKKKSLFSKSIILPEPKPHGNFTFVYMKY